MDNINAGGMAAPIDVDKGVISNVAFDKDYNYYDRHPYTDHPLIGVQIPFWKESCDFVIFQMPPHVPDKIGILPRLREFIDI